MHSLVIHNAKCRYAESIVYNRWAKCQVIRGTEIKGALHSACSQSVKENIMWKAVRSYIIARIRNSKC